MVNMSELFYVGGYQGQSKHCLYSYAYDNDAVHQLSTCEIPNASYLCFSQDKKFLYTVLESDNGKVASISLEDNGKMRVLNDKNTGGAYPCHLSVSKDGSALYTANYGGGSSAIYNLLPSGEIGERKALVDHNTFGKASMADPNRQEAPHAHYIVPVNKDGITSAWVCDLGLDAVLIYNEDGTEIARLNTPAGFGPRHLAFHHSMPHAYVLGELSCSVIDFGYDLKPSTEVPVLKENVDCTCAAIKIAPSGKFVLTSNRENNGGSISVLSLDETGKISGLKSVTPSGGICPRDFSFNTAGDKVFVAHQDSEDVVVFDWTEDGTLVSSGLKFEVQRPTCVLFT